MSLARLLPLLFASSVAAQTPSSVLRGVVVDSASGPLAGVAISAAGSQVRTVTSQSGQFVLAPLAQGFHTIVAQRAGYAPESTTVTLNEGDTLDVRIVLLSVTVTNTVAEAKPASVEHTFDRRRASRGGGRFITRADIERRNPRQVSDILRNVSGIRIVDSAGTTVAVSTRGPRTEANTDGSLRDRACVLHVGVDGVTKDASFAMDNISPTEVYGIEVFAGAASVPPEFGGLRPEAWCGLIMIWTRYGQR
jgi:hypothetical protein